MEQVERIKKVFNELRADNGHILDDFYDEKVRFIDPLGVHEGRESVKAYYKNLYQSVIDIQFDFTSSVSEGSRHVVVWTMRLKSKGLKSGEEVSLDGNSIIEFGDNGLVTYHRDYFDMGEFIYENIPGLGWVIKKVKSALKK